ncbi:hypothetical protein Tco_0160548 [Tanacetum coccineum]
MKRLKESLPEGPLVVSECVNPKEKVIVNPKSLDQTVTIKRQLPRYFKQKLIKLLRDNVDVFTWKLSDMTGIPRTIKIGEETFFTKHKLNDDKKITPMQQKKREMAVDRNAAASKEVEELKNTKSSMRQDTKYGWQIQSWKRRHTEPGDFTGINKACPKDCFRYQKLIGM